MNQTEMAAHDEITWKLYQLAAQAGARRMSAHGSITKYERSPRLAPYEVRALESLREALVRYTAEEKGAADNLAFHEANYTGWSRFWAVPNGHIHSSTHCSTCNNGDRPTEFYLLHEVSGMSEVDAVASKGAFICTVCFPSAPVELTNGYEVAAAAKKAAQCGGTYSYDAAKANGYRRYQLCTTCHAMQSITSTGKMRAHKAPAK